MTTWFYREGGEFSPFNKGRTFAKLVDENPDKGTAKTYHVDNCWRCGGAGGSDAWKFTGWTCYRCGGGGLEGGRYTKLYTAEKLEKLNATRDKARAKRAAKAAAEAEANWLRFNAENGYFADMLVEVVGSYENSYDAPSPLVEMLHKAKTYGELSDKAFNYATLLMKWHFERLDKEAGRNAESAASEYVGEVGKRLKNYTAKVAFIKRLEDRYYGYTATANYMVKLKDADGNFLVYFGSSCPRKEYSEENGYEPMVEKGDTVTFNAGVDKHSEYKGEKNTMLKRPHWSKVESAPVEEDES
jgi:hypothetical protein